MPRYDFICTSAKCKHKFEAIVTVAERPTQCPKCKSELTQDYSTISVNTIGCSLASARKGIQRDVKRDTEALKRGDEKVLADYCGDKTNTKTSSGVKYMKDVKKGTVKVRRK